MGLLRIEDNVETADDGEATTGVAIEVRWV
jgi:hypothetical protein